MNGGATNGHIEMAEGFDEEILKVADKLATVNRSLRAATAGRPGLFGDLAWELLVEIYATAPFGTCITSDLLACRDTLPGGPLTRYIQTLQRNELLVANQIEAARDVFSLSLTHSGRKLVRSVVESML